MAILHVRGEYRGPGERKTVETLGQQLPSDWDIVAGASLPGKRDDLDIVIIAPATVFLLEEKSWGPRVMVASAEWLTTHQAYPDPIERVSHLSRVLAGHFRASVSNYKAEVGRRHAVTFGVVLSNDSLDLKFAPNVGQDEKSNVYQLRDGVCATRLIEFSKSDSNQPFSTKLRKDIVASLTGLPSRNAAPSQIREYEILQEYAPIGYARCFLAKSLDRQMILRCIPQDGWGPNVTLNDIFQVATHEAQALQRLDPYRRANRAFPVFIDETRRWVVTPLEPLSDARNLDRSVRLNDPKRSDGRLPEEIINNVVQDAFTALHQVHGVGLIHRGICPQRVCIDRGLRISFTNFLMAKIISKSTIGPWLVEFDGDISTSYRAPECKTDPRLATTASDVYSLALCLGGWIAGDFKLSLERILDRVEHYPRIAEALRICLSTDPKKRKKAGEIAELTNPPLLLPQAKNEDSVPQPSCQNAWIDGNLIDNRYELRRVLGTGGFATTWLAFDKNAQQERVLKRFHDPQKLTTARSEFKAMSSLNHERCARTWDINEKPEPGYLVNEYVDGQNLEEFVRNSIPDAETMRDIAVDVLSALDYIHGKNLIHRDLSPRNIIIDSTGRAKLIDFGLCSPLGGTTLAGTPPYMAPELFHGSPASYRSDLYSIAVSMLHSMLGRLPYQDDPADSSAWPVRIPDGPSEVEYSQWGLLGRSLLHTLMTGTDRDPEKRPLSARSFKERLQIALGTSPVEGVDAINQTVEALRRAYRGSKLGNDGNRGLDDEFSRQTYVPTLLDSALLPKVLAGALKAVFLTGNPGDGKTAFLVKVRDALLELGATKQHEDAAGWRINHNHHSFVAVYDASESHLGASADDLLHQALELPHNVPEAKSTVLVAINDGRLIQFFTDYEHVYDDYSHAVRKYVRKEAVTDPSVAIVDLKQRSLATLGDVSGLAVRVAAQFAAIERWEACLGCTSRNICPIKKNADDLRSHAANGFAELVLVSHLRQRRRATFRDLRSALGWILTGDIGCKNVHAARNENLDLTKDVRTLLPNLAFEESSPDYLITEWTLVDPGKVAAPEIARNNSTLPEQTQTAESLRQLKRQLFFYSTNSEKNLRQSVRAYRHFEDFCHMLSKPTSEARDYILLGISRLAGASGFTQKGLAIAAGDPTEPWAVLKTIPSNEFKLEVPPNSAAFVEATADRLTLSHKTGSRIDLSLDTAEIILRAANGELLDDSFSDAIREEIAGFTAQLSLHPANSVHLIDSVGSTFMATRVGKNIVMRNI